VNPGFFARLEARVAATGSVVCVGLDPRAGDVIEARDRSLGLIAATASDAAAYKPNSAFFEVFGPDGVEALGEVIAAVPDEIPVILDAKRGDIASTAAAYASAAFEVLGAGAVTLSPYLGRDSIDPFLEHGGRGAFVLCRTSNPGGADLQESVLAGGDPLFVSVARWIAGWPSDRVGLVVGATEPGALAAVRSVAPDHWILAPGVGAQGADLAAAIAAGERADGSGLLLPVSRAIAEAPDPGAAVREMNAAVAAARGGAAPVADDPLAERLFDSGCIRFGDFELKSGIRSPVYLDLRTLVGHPGVLRAVARRYVPLLLESGATRLAGVPLAGMPLATAAALESGMPMVYPRPSVKDHGLMSKVDGPFEEGDRVVVLDDVATSGASILETVSRLRDVGCVVDTAVVLVDRGGGADEALAAEGVALRAVTSLQAVTERLEALGRIEVDQARDVYRFLAS
jgi:uridine monophosphate synthetase